MMKGQAKRFVSHAGKAYAMGAKKKSDNIGFLDLVSFFLMTEEQKAVFKYVVSPSKFREANNKFQKCTIRQLLFLYTIILKVR